MLVRCQWSSGVYLDNVCHLTTILNMVNRSCTTSPLLPFCQPVLHLSSYTEHSHPSKDGLKASCRVTWPNQTSLRPWLLWKKGFWCPWYLYLQRYRLCAPCTRFGAVSSGTQISSDCILLPEVEATLWQELQQTCTVCVTILMVPLTKSSPLWPLLLVVDAIMMKMYVNSLWFVINL